MSGESEGFSDKDDDPLMLLALNSDRTVNWHDLMAKVSRHISEDSKLYLTSSKATELAHHLEQPVAKLRGRLAGTPASPIRPERAR